jgi:hypothetical protein
MDYDVDMVGEVDGGHDYIPSNDQEYKKSSIYCPMSISPISFRLSPSVSPLNSNHNLEYSSNNYSITINHINNYFINSKAIPTQINSNSFSSTLVGPDLPPLPSFSLQNFILSEEELSEIESEDEDKNFDTIDNNSNDKSGSSVLPSISPIAVISNKKKSNCLPDYFFDLFPQKKETRNGSKYSSPFPKRQNPSDISPALREIIKQIYQTVKAKPIYEYLNMSREGFKHLVKRSSIKGRPSMVDDLSKFKVKNSVQDANNNNNNHTKREIYELIKKEVEFSAQRNNLIVPEEEIINRNLLRISQNIGVSFVKGQMTTDARWFAMRDIRNNISMASLLYLYKDHPSTLLGNMDATVIVVDFDESRQLAVVKENNKNDPINNEKSPISR